MKILTFLCVALLGLSVVACHETKQVDQDPGDRQLGVSVQTILEEENVEEAIWNPEGMDISQFPVIEVQSEEELREVIKSLHQDAQQMKKTFDQINEVSKKRFDSYHEQLSNCTSRRDSLQVALKYPDVTYLRDTSELVFYGLIDK